VNLGLQEKKTAHEAATSQAGRGGKWEYVSTSIITRTEENTMMKRLKLERAEMPLTRIELTVTHEDDRNAPECYVNVIKFDADDAEPILTETVLTLAEHMDVSPLDLLRAVIRQVRRRVWAGRILGMAQKVAPAPEMEPQKAQIIEIVAR
jgi:hypothetical protein